MRPLHQVVVAMIAVLLPAGVFAAATVDAGRPHENHHVLAAAFEQAGMVAGEAPSRAPEAPVVTTTVAVRPPTSTTTLRTPASTVTPSPGPRRRRPSGRRGRRSRPARSRLCGSRRPARRRSRHPRFRPGPRGRVGATG